MQGSLPPKTGLSKEEYEDALKKLSDAIGWAMELSVTNQSNVPQQHQDRAKQTFDNLLNLRSNLSKDAYLYSADIRGPEDYLIGFNFKNYRGFAVELVTHLYQISPKRLAQYVYHECVPEKGIVSERDDHRVVYNEIQSAVFGEDEVAALKEICGNL